MQVRLGCSRQFGPYGSMSLLLFSSLTAMYHVFGCNTDPVQTSIRKLLCHNLNRRRINSAMHVYKLRINNINTIFILLICTFLHHSFYFIHKWREDTILFLFFFWRIRTTKLVRLVHRTSRIHTRHHQVPMLLHMSTI